MDLGLHAEDSPALQDVLLVFVGVDSETDDLPLGSVRQWAPDALVERDRELAKAEALYANSVADACRRLLDLLEPEQP